MGRPSPFSIAFEAAFHCPNMIDVLGREMDQPETSARARRQSSTRRRQPARPDACFTYQELERDGGRFERQVRLVWFRDRRKAFSLGGRALNTCNRRTGAGAQSVCRIAQPKFPSGYLG